MRSTTLRRKPPAGYARIETVTGRVYYVSLAENYPWEKYPDEPLRSPAGGLRFRIGDTNVFLSGHGIASIEVRERKKPITSGSPQQKHELGG